MESRIPYDTDLTDAEWNHLEALVPPTKRVFEKSSFVINKMGLESEDPI